MAKDGLMKNTLKNYDEQGLVKNNTREGKWVEMNNIYYLDAEYNDGLPEILQNSTKIHRRWQNFIFPQKREIALYRNLRKWSISKEGICKINKDNSKNENAVIILSAIFPLLFENKLTLSTKSARACLNFIEKN